MILFPSGIVITDTENKSLLHTVSDVEAWVLATIAEKATSRRDALIEEWRPRLYADERITELPADADALATLILAKRRYRTRGQKDAAADPVVPVSWANRDKYRARTRGGRLITLFPGGLEVPDLSARCILAYVQNLEEWVIGALLGMINRSRKRLLAQYQPIIMNDPAVTHTPANEAALISLIVARDDYQESINH